MSNATNGYEAKRAARIERLRARAESKRAEAEATIEAGRKMAAVIPMGQPIHVGHHSEGRDRRYRAKIDRTFTKGFGALKEARDLDRRAQSAEANREISSDDPEAVEKLREKLAEHERQHATLLDVNRRLRTGASITDVAPMIDWWQDPIGRLRAIHSLGHETIPTANSSAEGRRLRARIAELEAKAVAPAREPVEIGEGRIEEGDNRVRVIFPGKPAPAVIASLRASGFRWAPSVEAWQRHASEDAWCAARRILETMEKGT